MIARLSMLKDFTKEQGGMMRYKDNEENYENEEERKKEKPKVPSKWDNIDFDANPSPAGSNNGNNNNDNETHSSGVDNTSSFHEDEESRKRLRQLEVL